MDGYLTLADITTSGLGGHIAISGWRMSQKSMSLNFFAVGQQQVSYLNVRNGRTRGGGRKSLIVGSMEQSPGRWSWATEDEAYLLMNA